MVDVYFSKSLRGTIVAVEPATSRGFDWAQESLGGYVCIGSAWRVECEDAYEVVRDAEQAGLCVGNRI